MMLFYVYAQNVLCMFRISHLTLSKDNYVTFWKHKKYADILCAYMCKSIEIESVFITKLLANQVALSDGKQKRIHTFE